MSRHKVEITGVNTANIKVLTNEEMLELFKKMKEKEYNIKFKKVSENEIVVSAKNKKDAMNKARELFNSDLKDIDINNITKYYYVIEINNKEMLVKVNNGKI